MHSGFVRVSRLPAVSSALNISHLVQAIGTKYFDRELTSLIHTAPHVRSCFCATMSGPRPKCITAVHPTVTATETQFWLEKARWHLDPVIEQVRQPLKPDELAFIQVDARDLPAGKLCDYYHRVGITGRLAIWCIQNGKRLGIEFVADERRSEFSEDEISWLKTSAGTLLSILAKHLEISERNIRYSSLSSLSEIDGILTECADALSPRESQVCARILYGLSTAGIALDIGVGEESVATYRKRAFQRLGISTTRELLLWYLDRQAPVIDVDVQLEARSNGRAIARRSTTY